jgi:hypothetical protein
MKSNALKKAMWLTHYRVPPAMSNPRNAKPKVRRGMEELRNNAPQQINDNKLARRLLN